MSPDQIPGQCFGAFVDHANDQRGASRALSRARRRAIQWLCLAMVPTVLVAGALRPGVAVADPAKAMKWVRAPDYPALLDDGDVESLRGAVRQSLAWLARQPSGRTFVFGPRILTATEQGRGLRRVLELLADDPTPDLLEERILGEFDVLTSVGRADGAVLVTGYHEPVIEAAERPSPEYSVPILAVPDDLTPVSSDALALKSGSERVPGRGEGRRVARNWSRAEIDAGRLAARGLALAWARDPVDVFFMEIEGSGTLQLPDGREVRVGYATTNGRPYRSIGRLLVDEGKLEQEAVSMQSIRAWLAAHPAERSRVLRQNESYVFFRRLAGPPVGHRGVPLTPQRSIATDARLFPHGALAFIRTERPRFLADGRIAWGPLSRFVLNQDTGGAIRGPGRVDLFWGRGPDPELAAGLMKQLGELHFLVPKAVNAAVGRRGR